MKTINFIDKVNNETNVITIGKLGEKIYTLTKDTKEVNNAIRWCNTHKSGDVLNKDKYEIGII